MGEGKGKSRRPVARETRRTGGDYDFRHPRQTRPDGGTDAVGPAPAGWVHPRPHRLTGEGDAAGPASGEDAALTPLTQFLNDNEPSAARSRRQPTPPVHDSADASNVDSAPGSQVARVRGHVQPSPEAAGREAPRRRTKKRAQRVWGMPVQGVGRAGWGLDERLGWGQVLGSAGWG